MIEEITDTQLDQVYAEGKQAFDNGLRRCFYPYIPASRALAAIWWNGWDAGEEIFYRQEQVLPD